MKECWRCGRYQAYYTKGFNKFDCDNKGNCARHKKLVNKNETCENWCRNDSIRKSRHTVCLKTLEDGLAKLSEMIQILREEYEDNETNPLTHSTKMI